MSRFTIIDAATASADLGFPLAVFDTATRRLINVYATHAIAKAVADALNAFTA